MVNTFLASYGLLETLDSKVSGNNYTPRDFISMFSFFNFTDHGLFRTYFPVTTVYTLLITSCLICNPLASVCFTPTVATLPFHTAITRSRNFLSSCDVNLHSIKYMIIYTDKIILSQMPIIKIILNTVYYFCVE